MKKKKKILLASIKKKENRRKLNYTLHICLLVSQRPNSFESGHTIDALAEVPILCIIPAILLGNNCAIELWRAMVD